MYPTYVEYRCNDHPEDGWIIDIDWYGHIHRHGVGVTVTAQSRTQPLPRPGYPMPVLIGWPSDVDEQLQRARASLS